MHNLLNRWCFQSCSLNIFFTNMSKFHLMTHEEVLFCFITTTRLQQDCYHYFKKNICVLLVLTVSHFWHAPNLYYQLSQWLSENFEKLGCIVSITELQHVDRSLWQTSQKAAHCFQREKHQYRQPVKAIMNCCSSKCPGLRTILVCSCTKNTHINLCTVEKHVAVPFKLLSLTGLH